MKLVGMRLRQIVAAGVLIGLTLIGEVPAGSDREAAAGPALWIWSASDRSSTASTCFRAPFVLFKGTESAELQATADHCSLTMYLNGHRLPGTADGRDSLRQDVSRWIGEGENVLAVHADGTAGRRRLESVWS